MSPPPDRSHGGRPGWALFLAGAALLLCTLALAGCTQPVIPSPVPAQTTPAIAATTLTQPVTVTTTAMFTTKASDYLTYTNTQYGFSLLYPAGWSVQEGKGGSVVIFSSPSSGMGDNPATVKISVEDLSANPMGPEPYKNAQLAKRQTLSGYNNIYDLYYRGTGFNGWKIGYTSQAGTLLKTFEIFVIRGTTAITITYSSKEDQFAAYSQLFDTMLKSFQLTG
jgi:hypothetical protein